MTNWRMVMSLRAYKIVIAAAFSVSSMLPASIGAEVPPLPASMRAPEAHLPSSPSVITVPVRIIREYLFIEGEVEGVRGKFMLDTGMEDALAINDHLVPLPRGKMIGKGFFGSGQSFDIHLQPTVQNVRIGGLRIPRVTKVRSQNAQMLEKITPDFLGWVGYGFFKNHSIKLDYIRSKVTFYVGGTKDYLRREIVVADLPFEIRKLPNHPLIRARIANLDAIVGLDTGMYGVLSLPDRKKAKLIADGYLTATDAGDTYDLRDVQIAGFTVPKLNALEVEAGPSAAAKPIGIVEDTELALGYALLRQYKTIWDYQRKRIYLLSR